MCYSNIEKGRKMLGFFDLKLSEKIGLVFEIAVVEKGYDPYDFAVKWCVSETCENVFDWDETLVSQSRYYILQIFEKEYENDLPQKNEKGYLYADNMFWFGYIITYWHFLEGISGKEIVENFNVCKIIDEYDVLHTVSVKLAIELIKEDDRNEIDEG